MVALHGRSEEFFAADPELLKRSLIFVLTRMQIRMHRYPRWCASNLFAQHRLLETCQYIFSVVHGIEACCVHLESRSCCRGN